MSNSEQWRITARALTLLGAYVGAALLLQPFVSVSMGKGSWWFSLPLSLALVQSGALAILLFVLFFAKIRRQLRHKLAARFEVPIRELLSDQAVGGQNLAALQEIGQHRRLLIERCLVELLFSVRGEGKIRLTDVAKAFGFVSDWKRQANSWSVTNRRIAISALAETGLPEATNSLRTALTDSDGQIRLTAARALARSSGASAKEIFSYALSQPLLVRALLAEELKKHAALIAAADLLPPRCDRNKLLAALGIMLSWRRSILVPGLADLINDPDPEIAEAALRLLPYAGEPVAQEQHLEAAFNRPEPSIRSAAAAMQGRLQICSSTPGLTRGLSDPDRSVVHSCASAIAELGPEWWPLLESEVLTGSPRARVALEALETAQSGRLSMARAS